MQELLGDKVICLQTFPASEGFFGIQDLPDSDEMLLLLNQGIYYEFIPISEIESDKPNAIQLKDIKLGTSYELMVTSDSGLWRYRMGDLIQFTSLNPYRIKVVGRTSQFISAFGEHVIGHEIEKVMQASIREFKLNIEDYHVCPNVEEKRYEWYIEFNEKLTSKNEQLEVFLDKKLSEINKYYAHLIHGQIINTCKIIILEKGKFAKLRAKLGKEGGQNKVIRLANNLKFALQLIRN
jgi:hypothetical protein